MRARSGYCIVMVLVSAPLFGQLSVVQDSEGKSSLVFYKSSPVNFNFQSSKINAGMVLPVKNHESFIITPQISFAAKDGVSKMLNKGSFEPESSVGGSITKYYNGKNDAMKWWYVSATMNLGNQKLYDSAAAIDKVVLKKFETSLPLTVGFNRDNMKGFAFGLAVQGIISGNNYSSLDDYSIATTTTYYNADSSMVKIVSGSKEDVKGLYSTYRSNFLDVNVMGDLLFWLLDDQIAVGAHPRVNLRTIDKPVASLGLGFYITKAVALNAEDQDPTSIVGGIVLEWKDIFQRRTTDSFIDRSLINVVVGYTFKSK